MTIRFRSLPSWTPIPGAWRNGLRMPGKLNYPSIVKRFETELSELKAVNVSIESGHSSDDLRLDGHLKQTAKPPRFPGVIVRLHANVSHGAPGDAKKPLGPLWFYCSTYDDWQANLWAIAMTMERLRAIAAYGTATEAEIYALFADESPQASERDENPTGDTGKKQSRASRAKQSTASNPGPDFHRPAPPRSEDPVKLNAARVLLREAAEDDDPQFARIMLGDPALAKRVFVAATMKAHPDLDGTDTRMRTVKEEWEVLSA
ncbi:MAG: hypothetical protein H8F28_02610 [Fibrella sp.]|nr:hypothetical protein [Armatimonadota bacterium]